MNTADEKGALLGLMVPGKFLPQPGALVVADLAQLTGLARHFYAGEAAAAAVVTVYTGNATPLWLTRVRRY
jgi:hypothetical protein